MHYAAAVGAYGSVMFLLNKEAKLDIKDLDGNTPLALALYRGYKELASILIQNKASVHEKLHPINEAKVLRRADDSDAEQKKEDEKEQGSKGRLRSDGYREVSTKEEEGS